MLLLLLSHFSRVRLCDPIDGSPLGSSVPEILQARTLEWVAISFSNAWKWEVKVKSLSHARLLATPWTVAHQAPPFTGFYKQEYWSGVPLPSPHIPYVHIKIVAEANKLVSLDRLVNFPYLDRLVFIMTCNINLTDAELFRAPHQSGLVPGKQFWPDVLPHPQACPI